MSWILFGVGVGILVVAFADRLPGLHRLPPPWGAVEPPKLEFRVEGRDDLRVEMQGPQEVILALELDHRNRHKIRDVVLSVWVVGSGPIRRCGQNGEKWHTRGNMLYDAEGPYWTETEVSISRNHAMWFAVEIREPGKHQIVVELDSPDFYDADGVTHKDPGAVLDVVRVESEDQT